MKLLNFTSIIFIFLVTSCSVKSSYCGKYWNTNDQNAINYLIIYKNSTYLHYYKKDSIILSQTGNWKLTNDSQYNEINLFNFCNYNERGVDFKKFGIYILVKDGINLNNGFDGYIYSSFKKE